MIDLKPIEFSPGQVLFREGDRSYHFYILQDGEVEVFRTGDDGVKIPLAVVNAGTSIGEFAMIDRLPRSATAIALSLVKAVEVSEEAYRKLLEELPDWAVSVMRSLVERLRSANELIRALKTVDGDVKRQIDSTEFDPETSRVTKTDFAFDDVPDLA